MNQNTFEDLQYDLCEGCAEQSPRGILAMVSHCCPLNTHEYRIMGSLSFIEMFNDMVRQLYGGISKNQMAQFQELLTFPHFRAMPNFETASYLEKFFYNEERQLEIRYMKRLRPLIKAEEDFYYSY